VFSSKIVSHNGSNRAKKAKTYQGSQHTLYSQEKPLVLLVWHLCGVSSEWLASEFRRLSTMNAPLPEHIRQALETVTLDDKYSLDHGRAFMSGVQALVRLPMLQRLRDQLAGKNTAGFISGYRGSPLGN
jgi:hypothetical protein